MLNASVCVCLCVRVACLAWHVACSILHAWITNYDCHTKAHTERERQAETERQWDGQTEKQTALLFAIQIMGRWALHRFQICGMLQAATATTTTPCPSPAPAPTPTASPVAFCLRLFAFVLLNSQQFSACPVAHTHTQRRIHMYMYVVLHNCARPSPLCCAPR